MGLQSKLFKGDPKLEACLIHDAAHVTQGAVGDHVPKIQTALFTLDDGVVIDQDELAMTTYGPSTAAAVLAFKRKRNIINRSYQTQADNIVGKMTIAALDREMLAKEKERTPSCQLYQACPSDVVCRGPRFVQLNFAIGVPANLTGTAPPTAGTPTDAQMMQTAFQESRRTLQLAIRTLAVLQGKLLMGNEIMTDDERRALVAVVSWLKIDPPLVSPEGKRRIAGHIGTAIRLMSRNLAVKTTSGGSPPMRRFLGGVHAQVYDNPDQGIDCGDPFSLWTDRTAEET